MVAKTLSFLRDGGLIDPHAVFTYQHDPKPRKTVTNSDYDFLHFLGRVAEEELVDSALAWLKGRGLVAPEASYDKERFRRLRYQVKTSFIVPGTSLSPVMERLLYALSAVKRPQKMIAIGIFCGYTLVWSAGSSCGKGKVYAADAILGIDIAQEAVELARRNFSTLESAGHIQLLAEDGLAVADRIGHDCDYLYLDADNEQLGKGLCAELLRTYYPMLKKGAWVLAHDTTYPKLRKQLAEYFELVSNDDLFSATCSFPIDAYGLELSVKR